MTIQASVKIEDLSSSDIKKSIDTIRNIIINGINDTKKLSLFVVKINQIKRVIVSKYRNF